MSYHGIINFENKQDLHAKVKTVYKNTIVLHIYDNEETLHAQVNFHKDRRWKYKVKKDKQRLTSSGYFEAIIIPRYILPQLDSFIDNHLVDKILLGIDDVPRVDKSKE